MDRARKLFKVSRKQGAGSSAYSGNRLGTWLELKKNVSEVPRKLNYESVLMNAASKPPGDEDFNRGGFFFSYPRPSALSRSASGKRGKAEINKWVRDMDSQESF